MEMNISDYYTSFQKCNVRSEGGRQSKGLLRAFAGEATLFAPRSKFTPVDEWSGGVARDGIRGFVADQVQV